MICPTDIYGKNTGPGQRATYLVPEYIKVLLKKKESFYLGKGENLRSLVHIQDVVDAFLLLVDNAVRGGGEAQWGLDVSLPHSSRFLTNILLGFLFRRHFGSCLERYCCSCSRDWNYGWLASGG